MLNSYSAVFPRKEVLCFSFALVTKRWSGCMAGFEMAWTSAASDQGLHPVSHLRWFGAMKVLVKIRKRLWFPLNINKVYKVNKHFLLYTSSCCWLFQYLTKTMRCFECLGITWRRFIGALVATNIYFITRVNIVGCLPEIGCSEPFDSQFQEFGTCQICD